MSNIIKAKLSIVSAVGYQILLLLLILLRPDLPVYSTTISEWAIGEYGVLMQLAFILSALCYFLLYLILKNEVDDLLGKGGIIMLLISAIGTVGVGLFVTDPYPPDFTLPTTMIHTIGGGLGMFLLPIAAAQINLSIARRNRNWLRYKTALKLLGFLPLIAFVGFVIHLNIYVIPLGEGATGEHVPIGYPPRIMFLSYHLWAVGMALLYIKIQSSNNNQHEHTR